MGLVKESILSGFFLVFSPCPLLKHIKTHELLYLKCHECNEKQIKILENYAFFPQALYFPSSIPSFCPQLHPLPGPCGPY